ncbi:MAG: shikimate kinase [Oscillospiraceae bacterium]|nr:shikimate kinase [Oscillospiraceae bacterium]
MSKLYGLIGRKLGHSYSVPIHFALGNDAYKLFEMEPEEIGKFVSNPDLGGINVTVPYKLEVMQYLDEISPEALEIGAVNTVVRRNGKLYGYNTDEYGFRVMLDAAKISLFGKKVMILGDGGASKTAQYCARRLGAREIVVIDVANNTPEYLAKHIDTEILINCTPVGMKPNYIQSAVELEQFPACEGVVDVIYNPLRTKLIMDAEVRGIKHIGGLLMLTAQAKRAHELFFDTAVSDDFALKCAANLFKENENIVLVGMPGSGKSTVGKILGEMSGRKVYELDEMIAKAAGKTIPEIFASDGEEGFRKIESQIVFEASKNNGAVIITGGGAVTREENYYPLHQNSRIYEIKRDLNTLATDGRPLSKDLETLKRMYDIRKPMYEHFADVSFENSSTAEECAKKVWEEFCEDFSY